MLLNSATIFNISQLYDIAWFFCNLQKFIADFREITPKTANAWSSALGTAALVRYSARAFILSFISFVRAPAEAAP